MLIEIRCSAFKSKGQTRPPIAFSDGLNVVLGDSEASNSIGKSTFLLVVDFAFGGDSYVTKSLDVQKQVGRHSICFAFRFDDGIHRFSRDTVEYKKVAVCNENYDKVGEMSLPEFHNFLSSKYHIDTCTLTFRGAVSRFSRIYQKENLNEKRPLEAVSKEPQRDSVQALLKLFGKFDGLQASLDAANEASDRYKAFLASEKYGFIPSLPSKTELRKKEAERVALENRQNQLTDPETLKGKTPEELMQIARVKSLLQQLRAKRSRLQTRIQQLSSDLATPHSDFQDSFAEIQKFFPGIDIRKVSEIENFHIKLSSILHKEIEESLDSAKQELALVCADIESNESDLSSYDVPTGMSRSLLSSYAETSKQIEQIDKQVESFNKKASLRAERDAYAEQYRKLLKSDLLELQDNITQEMRRLNDFVYEGKKKAPILTLAENSYTFHTPDDTGTGTSYKGLIVYDLSILNLTALPILIHDSLLLKNIGDSPIQRLLELYSQSGKQIFIALDKSNSYTETAAAILEKCAVLHLSKDGEELFGRSWSNLEP